jgi:hypothetical protein
MFIISLECSTFFISEIESGITLSKVTYAIIKLDCNDCEGHFDHQIFYEFSNEEDYFNKPFAL